MPVKRSKVYKQVKNLAKKLKIPVDDYKRQYRRSTTQFWKDERSKLKEVYIQQLRYIKVKQKNPSLIDSIKLHAYEIKKTSMAQGTLKVRSKIHTVPSMFQLPISKQSINKIRQQLHTVLKKNRNENMKRISVHSTDGKVISTPVLKGNIGEVINHLMRNQILPKSQSYTIEDFKISKIVYSDVKSSLMLGYTRSIKNAHEKWHIFDPVTARTNCVFQAIAICRNWKSNPALLKDLSKLSDSGKNLKKSVNPSKKHGSDIETLQEICNFVKVPIKLYNNVFEEIRKFEPEAYHYKKDRKAGFILDKKGNKIKYFKDDIKLYEVQKVGNHCVALLPKKDINHVLPEFEHKDIQPMTHEPNDDDKVISKYRANKVPHKFNEKIASWDIETSKDNDDNHVPYACSIAWMEDEKQMEKQFWGLDCLLKFLEFIHEDYKFNGYTLYAHNGGKYDINLLMKYALMKQEQWQVNGSKCIELNNAWIGFELMDNDDKKHKISFKDSFRILPMGLEKLCNELDVEHKKLSETVSHDEITLQNYHTFPALKTYLSHDVRGLLEAMIIFNKSVFEELGIDVTTCFTGASLSKCTFFRKYYKEKKYPVYTLSDDHDKFIRDGYFGGRVECFKMGEIKNAYYYDFTSLYPDVGRQHLPYGEPEEIQFNGREELPYDFFGFVKCMARTKDKTAIPKHAMIKDSRLVFPILENWTEVKCFSQEIDYNIYEYKFETGLKFKKACFMSKFFRDGFEKKATAKYEGKPAMAQCWKIIINSGYGFWGLRTKNRDGVIICSKDSHEYMEYLNTERLVNFKENEDGSMYCRVLKDLKIKDFNVGVASAISSYARNKLHGLLTTIRKVGGKIHYCDTDSVICDINLNDHPEIKEEYQWDGDGSELGSLKNECDEVVEKKLKKLYPKDKAKQKEVFKQLVKEENGNMSFDMGIITGCKQYALKKSLLIDNTIHDVNVLKCKGYSQNDRPLEYQDFEVLRDGGSIQQEQMQFRCPKSNYVSETDAFTIKTKTVVKNFRKVYSKGVVNGDSGNVSPLTV